VRQNLRSGTESQVLVRGRNNWGQKVLLLGFELVAGVGLELLRRSTKSWVSSIRAETQLRRKIQETRETPPSPVHSSSSIEADGRTAKGKRRISWKRLLELLKATAQEWSRDKCPQLGAALAYYAVFSLAPLILLLLGIFGIVYGGNQ
jgi:hypothetical protein